MIGDAGMACVRKLLKTPKNKLIIISYFLNKSIFIPSFYVIVTRTIYDRILIINILIIELFRTKILNLSSHLILI